MMRSNLFIVAQSGWKYLAFSFGFFVLFTILDFDFLALLAIVCLVSFIYVFRNPEREILSFEEDSILSPVDGVVTAITELNDSEYAYRIDIASSYLDVGLLRAPMNAKVESMKLLHGARLSSETELSKKINENLEIIFIDKNSNKVKVKHTLAQSFAPLSINIIESQTLIKSMRYGLMLRGVTSIYLPSNVRLNINLANELKSSQTLIAFLS